MIFYTDKYNVSLDYRLGRSKAITEACQLSRDIDFIIYEKKSIWVF